MRSGLPTAFVIPKEGGVASIDLMALIKGAPHRQAAIDFIKFATSAGPVGATCIQLNETCLNPDAKEDPKAVLKKQDLDKLYLADDALINRKRSEWLETWQREISPLFRQ
jgi:ABC-type Fe3+ transport system substrate-binding protein